MATKTFADWLNETKGNRSGSQLAKQIGVSQSQVSRWLTGKGKPAKKYVDTMATVLEVSNASIATAMELPLAIGKPASPAEKVTKPKAKPAIPHDTIADLVRVRDEAIAELAEMALGNSNGNFLDRLSRVGELVARARS